MHFLCALLVPNYSEQGRRGMSTKESTWLLFLQFLFLFFLLYFWLWTERVCSDDVATSIFIHWNVMNSESGIRRQFQPSNWLTPRTPQQARFRSKQDCDILPMTVRTPPFALARPKPERAFIISMFMIPSEWLWNLSGQRALYSIMINHLPSLIRSYRQ